MKNNNVHAEEQQKPSVVFKVFKFLAMIFFPIAKLLVINYQLTLCEKTLNKELKDKQGNYIPPYDWFSRQRRLNLIWGVGSLLPVILSVVMSYFILSSNSLFMKGLNGIKKDIGTVSIEGVKGAKKKYDIMTSSKLQKEIGDDIDLSRNLIIFGFLMSMGIGIILVYHHPITKETDRLRRELERAGFIRPEDNHTVVATEVGFLIDITGSVSREVADSDRIWTSLNVRVNRDVAENPSKRSLVFFKKAYELKKGGEYGFDKIPKE